MGASTLLTWGLLIVCVLASTIVLGRYMAKVFGGEAAPGDRFFAPIERLIYRVMRVDPEREQRWSGYTIALLAFSLVSVLFLYALQRVQEWLPLDPTGATGVNPMLAWNT